MAAAGTLARAAIAGVALLLAWRVIHVNAVAYDVDGQPRSSPSAEAGLDARPGDAAALLARAGELEAAGDNARAGEAYAAALALAPVNRQVLAVASGFFLERGDARGLETLFRLVAAYPAMWPRAFPVLAQTLPAERARAAWDAVAARNPPWIAAFVADACARGVDPAQLAPVVLPRAAAVTHAEAGCLLGRLRDGDRWEEAYLLWLNLLPRERLARVGFVYNGGFEQRVSGVGFDWILQAAPERDAGHVAEVVVALGAEGRRVLRVAYNGKRQAGIPARQFLVLAPGDYRLTGRARIESIKALKGIQWTLRCVRKAVPGEAIAASERFIGSGEWRPFSMEATVPADCPGQVLQLEPAVEPGTPAFIAGTAFFDDIALERP